MRAARHPSPVRRLLTAVLAAMPLLLAAADRRPQVGSLQLAADPEACKGRKSLRAASGPLCCPSPCARPVRCPSRAGPWPQIYVYELPDHIASKCWQQSTNHE